MTWTLVYEGVNPDQEGLREALCTLGNGYFATRGAWSEAEADGVHYPGTYLAGGYNRLTTEIAGRTIENEDLVNMPNWLPLTFRVDGGRWLKPGVFKVLFHRQELDMQRGTLLRTLRIEDRGGRQTTVKERRIVSMADDHLAALETTITAENWSGRIEIRAALDGRVTNSGVDRYKNLNNRHLVPIESGTFNDNYMYLKVRTNQSELRVAEAARLAVFKNGELLSPDHKTVKKSGYVADHIQVDMAQGESVCVEKIVALYTSRDNGISECGHEAKKAVFRAEEFAVLFEAHVLAWKDIWRHFDIEVELTDPKDSVRIQRILRLHTFHLVQTSSWNSTDLDVGIPARGLHGEAYRGHVFWDELFIFPVLNYRMPEITRSLLMYRYRRLDEARAAAREEGYNGAMYPWQSGSDGREESQRLHLNPKSGRWLSDNSRIQRHVNIAIVYDICSYYQATGDLEFMCFFGAEMLFEIARFWASLATYNENRKRFEIRAVMGPDEYHDAYPGSDNHGIDNNAYTNLMVSWLMHDALKALDTLPGDRIVGLREKLELNNDELERWEHMSRRMYVPFHGDGIISQFEGYDELEEFDWEGYRKKYGDIQRLDRILESEGDSPNRYKLSKQADVLMLFYLLSAEQLAEIFSRLGYEFDRDTIPRNVAYYAQRTSHGSTLSRLVHSWVLARRDRPRSWELFKEALESDFSDVQGGTTPEGIHLGAMAGTVDLAQRGFVGLVMHRNALWLNPSLPDELARLKMCIRYRGHTLDLNINRQKVTATAHRTGAGIMQLGIIDKVHRLDPGRTREFKL
jgi:alpha,alpha-trehalase